MITFGLFPEISTAAFFSHMRIVGSRFGVIKLSLGRVYNYFINYISRSFFPGPHSLNIRRSLTVFTDSIDIVVGHRALSVVAVALAPFCVLNLLTERRLSCFRLIIIE